ncbi:hypothetical protein K469DRAFT_783692 [Zopfia rhizophila CBS 207.26]|uniref:DDE-1 domain-containing protein n=1 Tax=Zopfia rhizophila CBS 207.26 TaxID=1314779 RepID=A0A6A6DWV3_9PEZI|nr:hypothetical protein K469DRAFT_783692 [Zopfia rhizophila CBS 207.26]
MDVWNFDETGFRIGVGGSQYVVIMQLIKSAESPSETNHDFTMLVETINAAGETIPPFCILKGKSILFQHVAETDLDPNTLLGVSDSGYTNDQLALDFIQHFNKFSAQRQQDQFRIFLFNGHGSYLTYEFVDYCWQKSIIPVALPSYCSHILQPLNVVVF